MLRILVAFKNILPLPQGCQPWEIDFLTIYQKLPKFSLLNGIFSLLKHELVTDYFKQFPYFAENWPKSSLLRPKIPYRIRKFLTTCTWQPCFLHISGLVQDCGIFHTLTMEIPVLHKPIPSFPYNSKHIPANLVVKVRTCLWNQSWYRLCCPNRTWKQQNLRYSVFWSNR